MDIFIHNFRPGVMDKLNLGSEVLRELNPRLIYAAISGFCYCYGRALLTPGRTCLSTFHIPKNFPGLACSCPLDPGGITGGQCLLHYDLYKCCFAALRQMAEESAIWLLLVCCALLRT